MSEIKKRLIYINSAETKSTVLRYIHPDVLLQKTAFLIFPALGVKAKYYDPLLTALAKEGYPAAVIDLQGQGDSSMKPGRKVNFGYKELLTEDIPAAIQEVRKTFSLPIVILGHSLGGQMASLFLGKSQEKIKGLILCTSCSVYFKGWAGFSKYKVLAGTQFGMLVSNILGYFPGHKLGFGGISGKQLIKDWARQARTGQYIISGNDLSWEEKLDSVELPVLALSLQKDFLAPPKAVKNLVDKMPNAQKTTYHLDLPTKNHFSWVKDPAPFLDLIFPWIKEL